MKSNILYNDEPVLKVGAWKVLCPNMYGKKYKHIKHPLLVHKCSKYVNPIDDPDGDEMMMMTPDRPEGNPHCSRCGDPVPEEIQGLLALYYMDGHDEYEVSPAGNYLAGKS